MKSRILPLAGASLLLAVAQLCSAQSIQYGSGMPTTSNGVTVDSMYITTVDSMYMDGPPACTGTRNYRVCDQFDSWGDVYGDTTTFFSLPARYGVGATFRIHLVITIPTVPASDIDNSLHAYMFSTAASGSGPTTSPAALGSPDMEVLGPHTIKLAFWVPYSAQTSFLSNGVRQFAIRLNLPTTADGEPNYVDTRFRAVMVGVSYTEVMGHYTAPQLPLFILRDPPGDASYGLMSSGSTNSYGTSQSVSNSTGESTWFKAKIGVSGQVGFGVTTDYSLFAEVGVSLEATQSQTSEFEYKTTISSTDEFTTPMSKVPDDLFIGSAVRYAYGFLTSIERPSCGTIIKDAHFASSPVGVESSYHYTESWIRAEIIPGLQDVIDISPVGSEAYKTALNQRDVWVQTLAMNDNIKASAPLDLQESFNGGGSGYTHSVTTTTTASMAIDYTVSLEGGVSTEFGAYLGGSGVGGGGELKMRNEFGNGATSSNATTNTMSYHMEDDDVGDAFFVNVRNDEVFGSFAFDLDSSASRTSCPYEGGYQIDQPSLSVGTLGNNSQTEAEVPVGTTANFQLYICNNSLYTRTYYLKFAPETNTIGGAILGAAGSSNINDTPSGIPFLLAPGQCLPTNLTLDAPSSDVVNFPNINLYLYSLCDTTIGSYITISAFYGEGNVGGYCIPVSAYGTSDGDYVDGVQIGDINNTGTGGGIGDTTYTNYSSEFSTTLSRNEQSMVTITTGSYNTDQYAVWIDFNRNAEFEESELLGTFQSTGPHQSHNIEFTVPNTAALGTTTLRVRGAYPLTSEPDPLGPCFNYSYAETEDYAVEINADTPQDCLGVENGPALPGTPCDDGNSSTADDTYNANCDCVGLLTTAVAEGGEAPIMFSVRPNPSTGIFQLNKPTDAPARVEVRDALGRVVMANTTVTGRVSTLDLSEVSTGIYQLIIEQEGRRNVLNIMVRR